MFISRVSNKKHVYIDNNNNDNNDNYYKSR